MTDHLLVVLRRGVDHQALQPLRQWLGVENVQTFAQLGIQRWTIGKGRTEAANWQRQLERLRRSELVRSVELDQRLWVEDLAFSLPNDPLLINKEGWGHEDENLQWSLINNGLDSGSFSDSILFDADIDAPEAWQFVAALPGEPKETVVAVFDSGIDWAHPDLQSRMWSNPGEIAANGIDDDQNGYVDDIYGYDFAHRDPDPMDSDPEQGGHGTHVAGIIGAAHNNSLGIAGINPYARLMAIKLLPSATYPPGTFTSGVIEAVDYAVKMGATVSNHSWGWSGPAKSSTAIRKAFRRAGKAGMLMVTANGNDINNIDYGGVWPAAIKMSQKITVAATDSLDRLSGFSNYGLGLAGIAAPGSQILSTLPRDAVDGPYGFMDGTSMAGPMVAGVASLIKSAYPKLKPAQIRARILKGVDQIDALADVVSSGGRLNAFKALHASAKDKLTEFSLSPQWKYGSQMRASGGALTGYGDEIWAQAGNQNNYDCLPMLFFDLPRLHQPIRSAEFQIQMTNFWTPASQERLEIRVNPAITPSEAIEYAQSYEDSAATHQELLQGDLLATVVLDKATYSGDQDTLLTVPFDAAGIARLNEWAGEANGRAFVLTVGIGGLRPVDALTGELLYGGISFSRSDADLPTLNLNFRKSASAPVVPEVGEGEGDTTPPQAPSLALVADTGSSNTDGITTNGSIRVSGLEPGATWQYSTDAGRNWATGFGDQFTLAEGNHFPGDVLARQIDLAGNISPVSEEFLRITVLGGDQDSWVPVPV